MKLLDKKTIVAEKAVERKQEIDEGIKLARKIDKLRETSSQEEVKLGKFRDASLKQIKGEIINLSSQQQVLINNIAVLQEEKRVLLIPLDEKRIELLEREQQLDDTSNRIDEEIRLLNQQKGELDNRSKEVRLDEERTHQSKMEIESNHRESDKNKTHSLDILTKTRQIEKETLASLETIRQNLVVTENDLLVRERDLKLRQKAVSKDESRLVEFEKQVNDKYQTLLRTIKRLK